MNFPLRIFRVEDRSMEPGLRPGDYLIVNRWFRGIAINDVVVFSHPKKKMVLVKRVNSVSPKGYYLVGDNTVQSEDSRKFGHIAPDKIIGKVVMRV